MSKRRSNFLVLQSRKLHSGDSAKLCSLEAQVATKSSQYIVEQQYQLFPVWGYVLVGLVSGQEEPVLVHKDFEIVSLVVNDYFIC